MSSKWEASAPLHRSAEAQSEFSPVAALFLAYGEGNARL